VEVFQTHESEREADQLFQSLTTLVANGGGHPPRLEAKAAGPPLETLLENDSTRRHMEFRDIPAAVNISSSLIDSSKRSSGVSRVLFTIGRIAVVITFLMSALFRLIDPAATAAIINSKLSLLPGPLADVAASCEARSGVPFATLLLVAGAVLESAAAVLIAMGILIRPAAIVLLIFTAIGIYGFNSDFQNGVRPDKIIAALNQLSILGALLVFSSRSRWAA